MDVIAVDGGRIELRGLSRTLRSLEKAGAQAEDLRTLMQAISRTVISATSPPSISGDLGRSIRAGRGKTKAVIRAGGARVPYAGPIHYGWRKRGIQPNPFLTKALQNTRGRIFQQLDDGLQKLLKDTGNA